MYVKQKLSVINPEFLCCLTLHPIEAIITVNQLPHLPKPGSHAMPSTTELDALLRKIQPTS